MNWNLFWGIYVLAFSVAAILIWYFLAYKKRDMKKKCISTTNGKVVGYSKVTYNHIKLPVVEYTVDGKNYNVIGPKFKGVVIKSFAMPFYKGNDDIDSNITTIEQLPEVLQINLKDNALNNIENPLIKLYPVGSEVTIFYNPSNPKMSYVQRYIDIGWAYNLILFLGIVFLILGICIILGPQIIMQ